MHGSLLVVLPSALLKGEGDVIMLIIMCTMGPPVICVVSIFR